MDRPDRRIEGSVIPGRPGDLTAEWLTAALGGPDVAPVERVDVVPIGTGQTGATYRLAVRYRTQTGTVLPDTFVVKLPAQDDGVRTGVTLGYRSEVEFYSGIAQQTKVPVPHCHHSAVNDDASEFVLLLDDLAPAAPGDQMTGCGEAVALRAVTALAGLHGPSWCDPDRLALPVGAMPEPGDTEAADGLGRVAAMALPATLERIGPGLSEEDRDTLRAALELVTPWLLADTGRYALMHGDYRLDNMLFDDSRFYVVDWQTLGVGLPARDLAYFTGTCLEPEIRAATETRLVRAYHAALLRYGVHNYDLDTCLLDYRFGMLQGPLIIALGAAFATPTERGEALFRVMLRRSCHAIRELGTLDLVRAAGTHF